jgi:hypothetical protein
VSDSVIHYGSGSEQIRSEIEAPIWLEQSVGIAGRTFSNSRSWCSAAARPGRRRTELMGHGAEPESFADRSRRGLGDGGQVGSVTHSSCLSIENDPLCNGKFFAIGAAIFPPRNPATASSLASRAGDPRQLRGLGKAKGHFA